MRRATTKCLLVQSLSQASRRETRCARPLVASNMRMMSSMKAVEPPLPSTNPGDAFQLLSTSEKAGASEDTIFNEQVAQVKEWWASPRYKGIKRPYSAEDVVSKRGTLQQTYPSSLMARKLFNLLEEKASRGEPIHTSALTFMSSNQVEFLV